MKLFDSITLHQFQNFTIPSKVINQMKDIQMQLLEFSTRKDLDHLCHLSDE